MIWKIARRKHNVVFVFGKQAKVLRKMIDSAAVPDRMALEKETDSGMARRQSVSGVVKLHEL